MIKRSNALFLLVLFFGAGEVFAQFPYFESFKNSTASDVVFGGQPTAYLTSGKLDPQTGITDPAGDGYLRLTSAAKNQKGFIHNKSAFSSQFGLKIEFEYFTYGASSGFGADGITFFLYDAAVSDANFKIGGFGGSLGYAQYQTANDIVPTSGVTGGYLGIGIDEFGNFGHGTELRVGGVGFAKSAVTLRGRGSGFGPTLPNSSVGNYRHLITKQDNNLTSPGRSPLPTQSGYRKIIINLKPATLPKTGYFVSVDLVTGGPTQNTIVLIDNFHYEDVAPEQLKYGIASSTGAEFNYHEIRNLSINTFEAVPPVAVNDLNNTTAKNSRVFIPVIDNDTDINGTGTILKNSLTKVTQLTSGAIIEPDFARGGFYYTPALNFSGKDSFTYTIKDETNLTSNSATVEIDVIITNPIGEPDNATTRINTPITGINVLTNDPSKTGVTVIAPTTSTQGGLMVVNTNGTIKYTPPVDFSGSDSFTYILRNSDNLESDPILVTIIVQRPPVAVNDGVTTSMDSPVAIELTGNDTDADGTVNRSSVVIKTLPANGTLNPPDAQGTVVYTPKPGYSGSDTFTYTIKDNDGVESAPGTVTITINSLPKIGIAKGFPVIKNSVNGTFIVKFTFTIGNYGKEPLEKVSVKDNLATAFAGAEIKVISVNTTGTLNANKNFNGISDTELLAMPSTLKVNGIEKIELIVNVLITVDGSYQNQAFAEAFSSLTGLKATDASVAGDRPDPETAGDVSIQGPTFFGLQRGPLYIPEGFSPNNDGINDFYIVSNSQGKNIALEVFNRWGNRVYKSADYKNDWDGRCTEGIYLGQDLPVGTYYYVIVIDNKDRFVGYITINR